MTQSIGSAPTHSRPLVPLKETSAPSASVERLARSARPEETLAIEPIELELGYRLIKLADPDCGGDLMERVSQLRNKIARELGIILPKVKIRDSLRLGEYQYRIRLRGVVVASGELQIDRHLAIDTGTTSGELSGTKAIEPVSGRPAIWIEQSLVERAEVLGYTVALPAVVAISHLAEIVRSHAYELLTRQQMHQLLDNLRKSAPKVVDELIPELLKPSHVHQILCNLLRERVPVRDLETILETLADYADRTKDIAILTEYARRALGGTICQQFRDTTNTIHALTVDPALEDVLAAGFEFGERGLVIKMTPQAVEGIAQELLRQSNKLLRAGRPAVVVCSAHIRPVLRHISQSILPNLAVLGLNEIARGTTVQSRGQIPVNSIKMPLKRRPDSVPSESLAISVA